MKAFGKILKESRKKLNITLRSVEEQTGISNAYLSQLENDKIKNPSPKILHKLSECYKISYTKLLDLAGYPSVNKSRVINTGNLSRLGSIEDISEDEEIKLIEYLEFLRSKRK